MYRRIPFLLFALFCCGAIASAQSSASYALAFDVFDNGGRGADNSSATLHAHSIVGQAAALHTSASNGYEASSGAECMFCGVRKSTVVRPAVLPDIMRLYQNYPNPFNPTTTLQYSLERGGTVELAVYNLLGEKVDVIVAGYQNPGDYMLDYDASRLQSGVYMYRLSTEHGQLTRRMVLMK